MSVVTSGGELALNILDYLIVSGVNLLLVSVGFLFGKPWLDRRVAKALQPPVPPQKRSDA